jgi:hypothetical protein
MRGDVAASRNFKRDTATGGKSFSGWFGTTNAVLHLEHGCPVDDVVCDLMTCRSGFVRDLEGKDQADALEHVGPKVLGGYLPHLTRLFVEMLHAFPAPHASIFDAEGDEPGSVPKEDMMATPGCSIEAEGEHPGAAPARGP